jgi:hypothetical protein
MTALSLAFSPDELRSSDLGRSFAPEGTPDRYTTPAPDRLIGSHHFSYPKAQFKVALLRGHALSRPASHLVDNAYTRLGYVLSPEVCTDHDPDVGATLEAISDGRMLGTLSVNLNGERTLKAESLYPEEIAPYRSSERVCEFTRLALDTDIAGREVLCSLFYVAYVYAHLVHRAKHLFVEVNPRHSTFYQRMLGFEQLGTEKLCPRVGAPAVLLHLDLGFTCEQIARARSGLQVTSTTLYRYAPPAAEEDLLLERIEGAR